MDLMSPHVSGRKRIHAESNAGGGTGEELQRTVRRGERDDIKVICDSEGTTAASTPMPARVGSANVDRIHLELPFQYTSSGSLSCQTSATVYPLRVCLLPQASMSYNPIPDR